MKLDLSKKFKPYFTASRKPEVVEFEESQYVSITGSGDPSKQEFAEKVQALYAVSYAIKFGCKMKDNDFVVPKLEGLWWFDESKYHNVQLSTAPKIVDRKDWQYKLLIRMPDFVGQSDIIEAQENVIKKKKIMLAGDVEHYKLHEGMTIQILHTGPFDKEHESLQKLAEFMKANDLKRNGLHHEIYLSDFRKTPPEKLKTILREPVKK